MRLPVVVALTVLGCTMARTQTVIEIHADGRVTSDADELRIEVRDSANREVFSRTLYPQSSNFIGFPLEIPITAKHGDESRSFELRVVATQQRRQGTSVTTDTLAQNRVRTSFRRGEVLRFTLWLLSGCRCNVETERCEPDADADLVPECVPITIDVHPSDASIVDSANDASLDGVVAETGLMCAVTQRLCGNQCVSRNSPVACGASCTRCDSVTGGDPICENNVCDIRCGASTPDRCSDACTNFDNDRSHCGNCTTVCTQGQLCVNRLCVAPPQCSMTQDAACTGQTYCNLTTRVCAPGCDGRNAQCPLGQMCNMQNNACVCLEGTRTCGSACVACPTGVNIASVGCDGNACIVQSCGAGFGRNASNTSCIDTNECNSSNGGCGAGTCSNIEGSFGCSCNAPNRMCGSNCVACPNDPNTTATVCSANSCVIGACNSGFSPNDAGTACQMTGSGQIFSGAPIAIERPSGAVAFGVSVSLSNDGNALAVGDYSGGGDTNGAATIYSRSGSAWSNGASVTRPSGTSAFGQSVSLSGDGNTLAVADINSSGGSTTIYTRSGNTWTSGIMVTRPNGARLFGFSVSLSGDGNTLVVGDIDSSDMIGSATVYARSSNTWSNGTNLTRPSGVHNFGSAVCLSRDGNTLVVGDYSFGNTGGSAIVYTRSGNTWSNGTHVTRPSGARSFGISVSLSEDGSTLVVGDDAGADRGGGSATVYTRSANTWSSGTNLTRPSGAVYFGISVSLSRDGNTLAVGDHSGGGDSNGAATVYTRNGNTWSSGTSVTRPSGARAFGRSISLSQDGNTLVVGDYMSNAVSLYTR